MEKLRIIVGGYIGLYPTGGAAWDYLQYPLGLHLLGHDVYYIEDTMQYPVFQKKGAAWNDASFCVSYLKEVMEACGLKEKWAYRDLASGKCFGMPETKMQEICASADVFINISCSTFLRDEYLKIPARILIDSDPMFTQIQYHQELQNSAHSKEWSTRHMVENHNYLFTFGENISAPDCLIPEFGFKWIPTRQPVCLHLWETAAPQQEEAFTSVMNWSGRKKLQYNHEDWGQKDVEFEKFKDLPLWAPGTRFEIVVNRPLHAESILDAADLKNRGWQILNPQDTVATPNDYKNFILHSLAEFSIAKETYVKSRSGWFSCRSACYLASGRPVVTEETGWSGYIPAGMGLFAFNDLESAVEGVQKIRKDPEIHSKAAKELAASCFDSNKVLTRMLEHLN